MLTVTDAFLPGDEFEVFDLGLSLGATSPAILGASCGNDPVPCLDDPRVSQGIFLMRPGAHEITIRPTVTPIGPGAAYFRVDVTTAPVAVPEPGALWLMGSGVAFLWRFRHAVALGHRRS
jgi:hypothetical protein